MKKNFLKATALVLSLMMLLCSCGGEEKDDETKNGETSVLTGADENTTEKEHVHFFGTWKTVKAATCVEAGIQERTCTCGKKETKSSYTDAIHRYSNWITQKAATCTASGSKYRICYNCGKSETKTISALGHNYENYECTRCYDINFQMNITLPKTPVTIRDYRYNESINTSCKVTSIRWEAYDVNSDGTVKIYIYWSGEQIYNYEGDNISSSCKVGYKLYDSEGYVVDSGTTWSAAVQKGEKFKDASFSIYNLDPNESYTLEFLDVK